MLTAELHSLTTLEEQELITEYRGRLDGLRHGGQPPYRADLPGHNYSHVYEDVLPEAMKLLLLEPGTNTSESRRSFILAISAHDAFAFLPLDPEEGFATKEERTIELVKPLLVEYADTDQAMDVNDLIEATSSTASQLSLRQRIMRRADISNVGNTNIVGGRGKRRFLGRTVDFFWEDVMVWREFVKKPEKQPVWAASLLIQADLLTSLVSEDLTLGSETYSRLPDSRRLGRFNLNAELAIASLRQSRIRNPRTFVGRYGHLLKPLVKNWDEAAAYIKDQVAA